MTIPQSSLYPTELDSTNNLFDAHDALRVRLAEDYNPGDIFITVEGNTTNFPPTGLITLTDQCSEESVRAISFYYGSRTETTFNDLEILPGFEDVKKLKKVTNVTQNVMAEYHENLKNAIIAVQKFLGLEGTVDTGPFGDTIAGRVGFLRKLVFTPRAWFTVDKRIGLVEPNGLEVIFKDQSFRVGSGPVEYIWDFGDSSGASNVSVISVTSVVPTELVDVTVKDLDGGEITKVYTDPGLYDVTLTVKNEFGEDTVTFRDLINARIEAPNDAIISFSALNNQRVTAGDPVGGPYTTPPKIRTPVNTYISMYISDGENPSTPGRTFAGELLSSGEKIDPISSYTWELGDDLLHQNLPSTTASYSIGGIYDLKLRVDTSFGSYRITTYEDAIDVVEKTNAWLYLFDGSNAVKAYEFGLISETWKTMVSPYTVTRDDSFLDDTPNEAQAKREFKRNTGFTQRGTTSSGLSGNAVLYWASGGDSELPLSLQQVRWVEFNGFNDTYTSNSGIQMFRPWNWVFLGSTSAAYFAFGSDPNPVANTNTSHNVLSKFALSPSLSYSSVTDDTTLTDASFESGAQELRNHVTVNYTSGEPDNGRFAVYRSAWKDNTGYFLRNNNVGNLFRVQSFYRTQGDLSDPVQKFKKLPDMQGQTKTEGQLVPLSNSVFFFNNSSSISAYNEIKGVWEVGGPTITGGSFRQVQDESVSGFDNASNTLLAASDSDKLAYLSFDYSDQAFYKFNGIDKTYYSIGGRPVGEQWIFGIF